MAESIARVRDKLGRLAAGWLACRDGHAREPVAST
jgi:hypothetical protein